MVKNHLEQRQEFLMLINPAVNDALADFRKRHKKEFKSFMELINLDTTYGAFNTLETVKIYAPLEFIH